MIYTTAMILHFIFDWILQSRNVAKNKKKYTIDLMEHLIINILPFNIFLGSVLFLYGITLPIIIIVGIINFTTHAIIDKYLPSGNNEREMINWTAVDQILHLGILYLTLNWVL